MLDKIAFKSILFLDIETVPVREHFSELSSKLQTLYAEKTEYRRKADISAEAFYDHAGIWAEFGKIVCISVGFFAEFSERREFRLKSFSGDEKTILQEFKHLIDTHFSKPSNLLCAHNGKEFDFPYIARRMIVNNMKLPNKLNLFGKKPWEVAHIDTMDLWKFGDYKHYTSLELLTTILNIPSPKGDIDGSKVAHVFYKEQNIEKIVGYCEKDTLAVAQLVLRFCNLDLLQDDEIISV